MDSTKNPGYRKTEDGNAIDMLGSAFVLLFMIVLVLAYSSFAKLSQQRMAIDNIAKEYLYAMEEHGYMSSEEMAGMTADLAAIGVTASSFAGTDIVQVTYGERVHLVCTTNFENPVYRFFSSDRQTGLFAMAGLPDIITYEVDMSATAKW